MMDYATFFRGLIIPISLFCALHVAQTWYHILFFILLAVFHFVYIIITQYDKVFTKDLYGREVVYPALFFVTGVIVLAIAAFMYILPSFIALFLSIAVPAIYSRLIKKNIEYNKKVKEKYPQYHYTAEDIEKIEKENQVVIDNKKLEEERGR